MSLATAFTLKGKRYLCLYSRCARTSTFHYAEVLDAAGRDIVTCYSVCLFIHKYLECLLNILSSSQIIKDNNMHIKHTFRK